MRALSSLSDGNEASPEGWLWTVLPEAREVVVVSAYLTLAGLELVQAPLQAALLAGADVLVVTGGRRDQVDARALDALLILEESFPEQLQTFVVPAGSHVLTAKSYGVRTRTGAVHAWIGSANLTRAGLSRNLQTGVVFSADSSEDTDHAAATKIISDANLWRTAAEAVRLTAEVQTALRLTEPGRPQDVGSGIVNLFDFLEAYSRRHVASSADGPPLPPTSRDSSSNQGVRSGEGPAETEGADAAATALRAQAWKEFPTPTGFRDLDHLVQGLHPGQLYLVAGQAGVGKSVLARDLARAAAIRAGVPALVLSMQSSVLLTMQAVLSAEARIPMHKLSASTMNDADWTRAAETVEKIADAPLHVSHQGRLTIEDIRQRIWDTSRLEGQPVAVVVVDSIASLATGSGRQFSSREQEVGHLTVSLKALAVEEHVAVVATSGLTRAPQQRTDKVPVLSDVRDSNQVVDSADVVILIHREDMHEKESPRTGEADLIVAKSRNSPTDTVTVAFQGHYSRFVDIAR